MSAAKAKKIIKPAKSFIKGAHAEPERVWIFDTTLRDGEQSPGASLTNREKIEIARALEEMGVDIIEGGFPITSEDDFEAVRLISKECRKTRICGLARCVEADIKRAGEALKKAAYGRIHVFLATSAIHRKHKLKKAKDEIIRIAVEGVKLARKFTPEVEFSPEDAARTEEDFLCAVVEAVIDAGATVVNIPDTVGYTVPERFAHQIKYLRSNVPNIDKAVISVHCHNDLGLGVANTLAAIEAGARQAEVTINGLGERAGNAALEEVVMSLKTRSDHFDLTTGIDTKRLVPTSRMVSRLTGLNVQRNKAIVGENAFAHEAGIHVHGVLAHAETYEIMKPEDVGISESKIVIGKHTGHHAIDSRLKALGYNLSDKQVNKVREQVKALADRKKDIFDADLEAIVCDSVDAEMQEMYQLEGFQVMTGSGSVPMATVSLKEGFEVKTDASAGDGPVSAMFTAVDRITGIEGTLEDYRIDAVTEGREALGEVHISVDFGDEVISARGASPDVLEASLLAYVNATNRLIVRRTVDASRKGKKVTKKKVAKKTAKKKKAAKK